MTFRPILAICGTTGVGKSKLAIELALAITSNFRSASNTQWHGARIINADAMQVYEGMDILTNKVSQEEQEGVEHLLMGFKKPGEQYVVGQWIRDAMDAIDETHRRNQLPIVVGGTSYWMQHLVFSGRLVSKFDESDTEQHDEKDATEPAQISKQLATAIAATSPELLKIYENLPDVPPLAASEPDEAFTLHSLLASLDPAVASRWHWKDTRKVLRSLQIIKQSGRLSSDIIHEQSQTVNGPRYRTLFLWLYAKPDILNPRLDARVDEMVQRGLLREVQELIDLTRTPSEDLQVDSGSQDTDFTLGIYQSIGYREFSQYLNNADSLKKDKLYADALERMKLSTRKYAKRQVRWIRNTLLPVVNAANASGASSLPVTPVYLLDATELGDAWHTNVRKVAEQVTRDFLEEGPLPDPLSMSDVARDMLSIPEKSADPAAKLKARQKVVCPVCTVNKSQPVMIEEGREWQAHVGTRTHRYLAKKAEEASGDQRQSRSDHSRNPDLTKGEDSDMDTSLVFTECNTVIH